MEHFSYSFAVSLLHSIWQSAIVLGFYYCILALLKNVHPLFKRNLLFGLITAQLCISAATFFLYFTESFPGLQQNINQLIAAAIPAKNFLLTYSTAIFTIYSGFVTYTFLKNIYTWRHFKSSYTTGLTRPSADIRVFTASKAHHFGIRKKIAIWYSATVHTPVVFGFLKPIILLPVALVNQLSITETETLIVHELTHIKYNDYLLNWLLLVTEAIYFFNPFVRIIAGKIKLEREKNCDIQVLRFNYSTISYADALLKTAKHNYKVKTFQLAAVINQSQLLHRIRFFSAEKNLAAKNLYSLPFSFMAMLLMFVSTVILMARPAKEKKVVAVNHTIAAPLFQEKELATDEKVIALTTAATVVNPETNNNSPVTNVPNSADDAEDPLIPITSELSVQPTDNPSQEIKLIPAAFDATATPVNEGKQVIINQESSEGKMVTKAYKVQLKDGVWVSEPLWMISEIKGKMLDSLTNVHHTGDTIFLQSVPAVQ